MARRGRLILLMLSLVFVAMLINLFRIMYYNPAQSVVSSQSKWTLSVSESRGTIYDRHLSPLVNTEQEFRAACTPNVEILTRLNGALTEDNYKLTVRNVQNGAPFVVPLLHNVVSDGGLLCFSTVDRYAHVQTAPHIIGYCHDGIGVSGIELACEKELKQYSGTLTVTFETNGHGQQMNGIEPTINDNTFRSAGGVSLTLDGKLQRVLEQTTERLLTKGAVVVLDPYNGDILSCVSYPTYHPDAVSEALEEEDGALINRALSLYDCGSVFKIVTAAAALEHGISADKQYVCDGSIDIGGTVFHCHNRNGHGTMSLTEAFSVSCNTYFIQLAREIGADALYSMANTLGFSRKITLADGVSAASPLLPNRDALEQPAALANLSFGQGYLMTTPLHIAQLVATVTNGGVMPSVRLLRSYVDENMKETAIDRGDSYSVLSRETAVKLQQMLCAVVESGTGQAAKPRYATAAGKTGTAETGQKNGNTAVVQSWFAGYYPADNPQYVIVVVAEDSATTGENASSIFCEICNNLFQAGIVGNK